MTLRDELSCGTRQCPRRYGLEHGGCRTCRMTTTLCVEALTTKNPVPWTSINEFFFFHLPQLPHRSKIGLRSLQPMRGVTRGACVQGGKSSQAPFSVVACRSWRRGGRRRRLPVPRSGRRLRRGAGLPRRSSRIRNADASCRRLRRLRRVPRRLRSRALSAATSLRWRRRLLRTSPASARSGRTRAATTTTCRVRSCTTATGPDQLPSPR